MQSTCNWQLSGENNLEAVVSLSEEDVLTSGFDFSLINSDSENLVIARNTNSSESAEIKISFNTATRLNNIRWVISARICEIYALEHGKKRPSYIATKRCAMTEKTVLIDNAPVQLFTGNCSMSPDVLLDGISVRCLSIKEKVKVAIRAIHLTGKSTIVTVTQPSKEGRTDLYVPEVPKQENLSKMIQATILYQNMYDNKLKSLEERVESSLSQFVQSLTESISTHHKQLLDRIEVLESENKVLSEKVESLEQELNQLKKQSE